MNRFVITGTGHCGTAWLTAAFNLLGVPTSHEAVFTLSGIRPWPSRLQGDVSLVAVAHLDRFDGRTAVVVRDPLAVLNSFLRGWMFAPECPCHPPGAHLGSPLSRHAMEDLGVEFGPDDIENTIRYLLRVDQVVHAAQVPVWRIEDVTAGGLVELAWTVAGVPWTVTRELFELEMLPPPTVNAHGGQRPWVTWDQIDGEYGPGLRELAERYGYLGVALPR